MEEYFKNLDSGKKAYVVGTILYNIFSINEDNKTIYVVLEDIYCDSVKNIFENISDIHKSNDSSRYVINNEYILNYLHDFFNISDFSQFRKVNEIDIEYVVKNNSKTDVIEFFKAYYEKYGNLCYDDEKSQYKCSIVSYSNHNLKILTDFFNIPFKSSKFHNLSQILFSGVNIIDFLGLIYGNVDLLLNKNEYLNFLKIINDERPELKFLKTSTNAIQPLKANFSDVGYDLSIINEVKNFNSKTKLYGTGIILDIPVGYYVEIVPRSSISKSGYILANSIGIIDCSYKGELYVALTKIVDEADDITFPFKCCQMIMKKQIYPKMIEVKEFENSSKRADGGFGSSG